MRNIIITGGGMSNKGAQSMTFVAINELRRRFPNHEIYVLSEMDLDCSEKIRNQYTFQFVGWHPLKFAHCQKNIPLRWLCLMRNAKELVKAERLYKKCEMIVDISGYVLGSNWTDTYINYFLDHLEFAKCFDIPVYLMPQSFGPFNFGAEHPGIDERCRKLLPTCRAILAREQEGYDALVDTYGLTNVQLAPDLVLNNKEIDLAHIFKTVPVFDLPEIIPGSIAVIPNGRNLSVGGDEKALQLYQIAIRCGLEQGKQVYLLHHASSDLHICRKLKTCFPTEKVTLLEREFSCLEFNALVQRFDYLVASRFHSIVHAYKNGIPCVILGWARKYEDLAALFEQHSYLFDVRDAVQNQEVAETMNLLNCRRKEESQRIITHLAAVQQHNVFDILSL